MSFFNIYMAMNRFLNKYPRLRLRLLLSQTDMFGKECCCVRALRSPAATKVPVKPLRPNKTRVL